MGTSSSYGGPSGTGGLLPPWATAPVGGDAAPVSDSPGSTAPLVSPPDTTPISTSPIARIPWSVPKSSFSRYSTSVRSGRPVSSTLKSAARGFVKASGGSGQASRASVSGRATVSRLGVLLSTASRTGAAGVAQLLGLKQYVGASSDALLAAITNYIAPDGAHIEDAIARRAASETAVQLAEQLSLEENGLEGLERLSSIDHAQIIEQCVANYIYFRIVDTIAGSVETNKPVDTVISVEQNLRDYIDGLIKLEALSGVELADLDWNGGEGTQLVERLYNDAYQLIEDEV